MSVDAANSDPSTWDPAFDAVVAAPKHHRVLFENESLRVLEVTLEPEDEEPVHHHRWPSVFVFDQVRGRSTIIAPDGTQLPAQPRRHQGDRDVERKGLPRREHGAPAGRRVFNGSDKTIHGVRIEMKTSG